MSREARRLMVKPGGNTESSLAPLKEFLTTSARSIWNRVRSVVGPARGDQSIDEGPFSLAHVLWDELEWILKRRILLRPELKSDQETFPAKTLENYYKKAHTKDLSAICLSGGGIRSAAFAFGVLQVLADRGVLKHFDFLSTVSGGGYAGSFLTAWVQRTHYEEVITQLRPTSPPKPDSPISYIRRYSKYLTPNSSLLSADVLAIVALFTRNLFLNWLIIFPFIVAAVLFVKLAAIFTWWVTKQPFVNDYPAIFAILAIAFTGSAYVDSLRQRPGWESEKSASLEFNRHELLPMCIGALFAMLAALNFFASLVSTSWWVVVVNVAGTGAVTALTVWLVAYYFSHQTAPPNRSTRSNLASEETPRYAVGTAIGFTISGAVSGFTAAGLIYVTLLAAPYTNIQLCVVVFGPPLVISSLFVGELVYTGLTSDTPWADAEREWLARAAGYHGLISGFYLAGTSVVLLGSPLVFYSAKVYGPALIAAAGGLSALTIATLGKAPATAALIKSAERSWTDVSLDTILSVATPVFIVSVLVLISSGLDYFSLGDYLTSSVIDRYDIIIVWSLVAFALFSGAYVASVYVNINRFSLHNVYRNRLIRTFLGASNSERNTNAFTDFDERDNIRLCDIWPGRGFKNSLEYKSSSEYKRRLAPNESLSPDPNEVRPATSAQLPPNLLVVNMALNVLSTPDLDLQERRALPFFATPRWIGTSNVDQQLINAKKPDGAQPEGCFRRSEDYGSAMTLGTAITISGAAASPNMGYHSSPSLGVLLTLLNVRLGAWLGNPGPMGHGTYKKTSPKVAALPLLFEALGLTTSTDEYIYLSDGGHFENLGAYEMLRRRCKYILIADAGCDPLFQFEDLGNLVRKAHIDFGIDIKFRAPHDEKQIAAPHKGAYLAIADIYYPNGEADSNAAPPQGILAYLKPGAYGSEPLSVRSYWNLHPEFPHETTVNQWFGESQFEAYRALGAYAAESTLPAVENIADFFSSLAAQSGAPEGKNGE